MNKLIIANWKSNKNAQDARTWVTEIFTAVGSPRVEAGSGQLATVVLCPAFSLLSIVADTVAQTNVQLQLGVQTVSPYPAGSYTGGVSVRNLEGLPVRYAILGHSERRQYFHETSNDVAKQVEQALSAGIIPIVCVDKDYITTQAAAIADEVKARCIIAYEPAGSIGVGQGKEITDVTEVLAKIKKTFGEIKTMYGGSVSADNVAQYLAICDGVIVGTDSLNVSDFVALVQQSA